MVGKVSYSPMLGQGALPATDREILMADGRRRSAASGGIAGRGWFGSAVSNSSNISEESGSESEEMAFGLPDRYVGVCLLGKGGYGTVL